MEKNKGFRILAIFLFLSVYLLPMFPHGGSANELTRWATAVSIVERTSFDIGWTEELIGPNDETARVGERTFSNKPPGIALLAVPVYALTRAVIGPPDESNIRVSWFVMRFSLSTLPLLFLAVWLYGRDSDEISLAVLLFATPLFAYSLLFFSHVLVGVLIYLAFRLIYDARRIFLRNCFAAGAISGLAVLCEFPAAVAVSVLGAGLAFASNPDRGRSVFFFVIGGAPFAIVLFVYNYALFGSPFSFSYGFESNPEWAGVASKGIFGIGLPTIGNVYLLLFSPSRGLFFFAPVLLLCVAALFTSRERKTLRHRVKIAVVAASLVAMFGHGAAHGGWTPGPRYLVFILPLLLDSFFDGEVYDFSNIWQGLLFTVSFVFCTLPVLTFPFAPPEFRYPHNNFWAKLIWEEGWFTPNLANVFGLPAGVWTIAPAVLALLAVFYVVWRYARRPARFFAGSVAGVLLVAGYLAMPNLDLSAENRFRRATIAERYFRPAGRLENFRWSQSDQRIREFEWLIADTRAYAPNDFPYLAARERGKSPSAQIRRAVGLAGSGDPDAASALLSEGKELFPFARCEIAANLAVIRYQTGRRDEARTELESVQDLIGPASRPDCLRSQFLLGSLYRELGLNSESEEMFRRFIANTVNSNDPQIRQLRRQLGAENPSAGR